MVCLQNYRKIILVFLLESIVLTAKLLQTFTSFSCILTGCKKASRNFRSNHSVGRSLRQKKNYLEILR